MGSRWVHHDERRESQTRVLRSELRFQSGQRDIPSVVAASRSSASARAIASASQASRSVPSGSRWTLTSNARRHAASGLRAMQKQLRSALSPRGNRESLGGFAHRRSTRCVTVGATRLARGHVCPATITSPHRVASRRNVTRLPQQDRTVVARSMASSARLIGPGSGQL